MTISAALPEAVASASFGFTFDHSYSRLPEAFFREVRPTPVREPRLVVFNRGLAHELGLDADALAAQGATIFAGNSLPPGALPLAQAYSGHQFGHFTRLGDGRAILFGEQLNPEGRRFDLQWKGGGPTPYSRGGDGRAALGPMLREYVVSEAMYALGVPTTRSLAVAASGEPVFRETPLPGAVLTRVATSHLRVGTFEHAAALGDPVLLRALADYAVKRHFPAALETDQPYVALLSEVVERQAALLARWQLLGFVHGVMNTDNMAISGETLDYGPCAFLEVYDPETVFSSIDHQGRYAYGHQPQIAQWNLCRLAEALLPLLAETPEAALELGQEAVDAFAARFAFHWQAGVKTKLGLTTEESGDEELVSGLFRLMHQRRSDFTNTFRSLSRAELPDGDEAFSNWLEAWKLRLQRQPQPLAEVFAAMEAVNPAVTPRNLKVEEALEAAAGEGNFQPFERLLEALAEPYNHRRERTAYQQPASGEARPYRTFCGT